MKFEDMINTIQLGNCYELIKKIPDKSIDCVYVDVPYLMKKGGAGSCDIAKRATRNRIELLGGLKQYNANLSNKENLRIAMNKKNSDKDLLNSNIADGFDYKTFIDEAFRIMKKPNIFIWCSPMQIKDIIDYIYIYIQATPTILVWCKSNPIPTTNNLWLSDVEYCIYVRGEGIRLNDGYELKSKWYISPINQSDKDKFNHPTIKPLELVKRHILHSTQPNNIVLDCFCGSGTTCVACKETGRRFIGMEIDPEYHKIAVNRLNGITANGQTSIFTDFENIRIGDE